MVSQKMYELGSKRSVIREIFEFGKKRAAEIGADNVYDFSLGNPSAPAPESVKQALLDLLTQEDSVSVHSYTSAQGDPEVRQAIADYLNGLYGTDYRADRLYMTVGAAASLSVSIKAVAGTGDEVIAFAPFFTEYKVFVEAAGASLVVVPPKRDDFQIEFADFERLINEKTKAVLVNSPNNPTGVVYSEETVVKLCELLKAKEQEYGHAIYLITDEPYREIVYDGVDVPFFPLYYANTLVCYSYSKSLSVPGERIGYVLVPNGMEDADKVYAAICGAGRALGYVCAPSLFQKAIAKCLGETADLSVYKENRDLLYQALKEYGYECVYPQGAFYLFVKALEEDANAFCARAQKHDLLFVPGDDFGCPGYVRISYCVPAERIRRSLPAFERLAEEYRTGFAQA
ncbi:pyridoxal phosphate-dependent aminotransferase [Gorillibacterium timonense]|uniref:pyridoxal phosphate-dependent aminotransferase n=1 Tax=Gorillibacterium timonense TaxID=1689269 RepID=UPI00071C70AA|nr:pyridoxal phosphate-dependent aminotransferase [Gorillibacterium timonense]